MFSRFNILIFASYSDFWIYSFPFPSWLLTPDSWLLSCNTCAYIYRRFVNQFCQFKLKNTCENAVWFWSKKRRNWRKRNREGKRNFLTTKNTKGTKKPRIGVFRPSRPFCPFRPSRAQSRRDDISLARNIFTEMYWRGTIILPPRRGWAGFVQNFSVLDFQSTGRLFCFYNVCIISHLRLYSVPEISWLESGNCLIQKEDWNKCIFAQKYQI